MTKIDIFSGFLGAGKTTLIKKLIKEGYKNEKLVLIENEFGEIGIDGGFLKEAGIQINEMNSGCICCSLVGDFRQALTKVLEEYHPDRIIIEPSGVGKLSDVINAVKTVASDEVILNSFVTVADATKCKIYMKNFGEFYNNQIESASTIILSRTQNMTDEKIALLEQVTYIDAEVLHAAGIENLDKLPIDETMNVSSMLEMFDETAIENLRNMGDQKVGGSWASGKEWAGIIEALKNDPELSALQVTNHELDESGMLNLNVCYKDPTTGQGIITFKGTSGYNEWYDNCQGLTEVSTEKGKNLLTHAFALTLIAPDKNTSNIDGNITSNATTLDSNGTITKTIPLLTDKGIVYITIHNNDVVALHTGGNGNSMFYIISALLVAVALGGAIVYKKRKTSN